MKKPMGIKKASLPRVPHVKRRIGKVVVADTGVTPRTFSKGDLGALMIAFSEKVAPGEVLFERNVFPSRPSMMRMSYKDAAGKKKLHKSFSDLLDWLHARQPLNFYTEMKTNCMKYLTPSDLLGGQPAPASTPTIPTVGGSSASPLADAAALLLGSDSESEDDEVVVVDSDED